MPRENYYRIVKGYEPEEPAGFSEKLFFIIWSLVCASKVVVMRVKLRTAKEK